MGCIGWKEEQAVASQVPASPVSSVPPTLFRCGQVLMYSTSSNIYTMTHLMLKGRIQNLFRILIRDHSWVFKFKNCGTNPCTINLWEYFILYSRDLPKLFPMILRKSKKAHSADLFPQNCENHGKAEKHHRISKKQGSTGIFDPFTLPGFSSWFFMF